MHKSFQSAKIRLYRRSPGDDCVAGACGDFFGSAEVYCTNDDVDAGRSHSVRMFARERRRVVALYMPTPFREMHLSCKL